MASTFHGELSVVYRCGVLYCGEQLAPLGLSNWQHSYILHICKNPGITQEGLAKLLYVNKSTVARQLAALETEGFIRREASETDARALCIFPTEKGKAALPEVRAALARWREYLTEDFTEEERKTLSSMMQRMRARAVAYAEGGVQP